MEGGLTKAAVARQFHTAPKAVGEWVKRFKEEGVEGSTAPHALFHGRPNFACHAAPWRLSVDFVEERAAASWDEAFSVVGRETAD